jgi:cbb3-type cytochrome oxidase subunit 1
VPKSPILRKKKKQYEGGTMDRFVKNFIVMSIVYLGLSSILGVCMLWSQSLSSLKFVHSHLNMLGWVSMMIYGVGYHVLPRFSGRPLKYPKIGELQFWVANIGLVGMLLFYTLGVFKPLRIFQGLSVIFGIIEVFSIFLFFYNMLATLLPRASH